MVNCEPLPGSLWTRIVAAVGLDDLAGGGQPQAAAAGPGREEGVEDPGADLLGHPHAVSVTSRTTQAPSRRVGRISSPPSGIACSALRIRFKSACLNRSTSSRARGQVVGVVGPDRRSLGSSPAARRSRAARRRRRSGRPARAGGPGPGRTGGSLRGCPGAAGLSRRSRSIFWRTRRSRGVSGFWKSSASRSRFRLIVESGLRISWARPPASWAISAYWARSRRLISCSSGSPGLRVRRPGRRRLETRPSGGRP